MRSREGAVTVFPETSYIWTLFTSRYRRAVLLRRWAALLASAALAAGIIIIGSQIRARVSVRQLVAVVGAVLEALGLAPASNDDSSVSSRSAWSSGTAAYLAIVIGQAMIMRLVSSIAWEPIRQGKLDLLREQAASSLSRRLTGTH